MASGEESEACKNVRGHCCCRPVVAKVVRRKDKKEEKEEQSVNSETPEWPVMKSEQFTPSHN